jgi:hypothetical protein
MLYVSDSRRPSLFEQKLYLSPSSMDDSIRDKERMLSVHTSVMHDCPQGKYVNSFNFEQ